MPADPPPPDLSNVPTRTPGGSVQYATAPDLPPDVAGPANFGDDAEGYLGVGMTVEVVTDEGLGMGVPAAPAGSGAAVFMRRHAGCAVKVVSYAATRAGQKPAVPSPRLGDNEVLLSRSYAFFMPQPALNGRVIWALALRYVYGLQVMPGLDDQLDFGTSPLLNVPAAQNVLNPADYTSRFTTPASAFTAGTGLQVPGPVTW